MEQTRGEHVEHLECASEGNEGLSEEGTVMPVRIETTRFNLWNLIVIAGGIAVNAAWAGYIWNDTQRDIKALQVRFDMEADARKDRLKTYQDSITGLQQQVAQIPPISFQVTRAIEATAENKKAVDAANDRIDRVVESFGGKLDNVIDTINKVSTQVQVLSSKLDDIQGKQTDKTTFKTPVIRP